MPPYLPIFNLYCIFIYLFTYLVFYFSILYSAAVKYILKKHINENRFSEIQVIIGRMFTDMRSTEANASPRATIHRPWRENLCLHKLQTWWKHNTFK